MLLSPGPRCEVRKGGIKPSKANIPINGQGGCPETLGTSGVLVWTLYIWVV